jgi:hypothetical protein
MADSFTVEVFRTSGVRDEQFISFLGLGRYRSAERCILTQAAWRR